MGDCVRLEDEAFAPCLQAQIKNQILTVIQPLGVQASRFRRGLAEGDAAAAGQEALRIDLARQGQGGRRQSQLKAILWISFEKARDHVDSRIRHQGRGDTLKPALAQAHAGVGDSDNLSARLADRAIASCADIAARL